MSEPIQQMTCAEAIEAVRAGRRCVTSTTIHGLESPDHDRPFPCIHRWRVVACDSETDVVECYHCGQQMLAKCDFDDEYA